MTRFPTLRTRATAGISRFGAIIILGASVLAIGGWLWFHGPLTADAFGGTAREPEEAETRK